MRKRKAELKDVIEYYRKKLRNMDQVVGLGRGFKEINGEKTDEESIQFLVKQKKPKDQLRRRDIIPAKLAGYYTDVIQIGHVQALSLRTNRIRPARPGLSLGHYLISAGTFGAVVYDLQTGQPLILSNNHILANTTSTDRQRAEVGDPILQPGSYDGGDDADVVGYLERYVPIEMENTERVSMFGRGITKLLNFVMNLFTPSVRGKPKYRVKMVRQGRENLVDCAVATPVNSDIIRGDIIDIGKVAGVNKVELGTWVQKSGRTSGLTSGRVRTLDAMVTVEMGNGETAVFTDQIVIDASSQGGDSGSLVLDEHNKAVGLLFAGSEEATICNPIMAVLNALKVRF